MDVVVLSAVCAVGFITLHFLRYLLSTSRNYVERLRILPNCLTNIASKATILSKAKERRSANYHPSVWDPKLIEGLGTPYSQREIHDTRIEELKQEVKRLFVSSKETRLKLKLIDSVQRLGVAHHFEKEIKEAISSTQLHNNNNNNEISNLYTTSLHFRLLRELVLPVTSDVFERFRSKDLKFMESVSEDIEGLLSLYEASYLGIHGEGLLEDARIFSSKCLRSLLLIEKLEGHNMNTIVGEQVRQSLEVPLHWRMRRIEARNFIDIYAKDDTKNSVLLELAKLDYNLVQSLYQTEVKELARWWNDLGFKEKLSFSRDRLMENYLWVMGIKMEPYFSKFRIFLTKFVCILTAIDDMYDIYGSLDELELFTDAVTRWDTKAMDDLPQYMRICYMAMLNLTNEMAYDVKQDHGLNILPYLVEEWKNLCASYLVEARWFSSKYIPTLKEYLENAWISVGGHAGIVNAWMLIGCTISKDSVDCFKSSSKLIYWSSLITRLTNDLGTHSAENERGDVKKSVQCYMIEEGVSEEEAKDHIKGLISYSWKKLNEEIAKHSHPKFLVDLSLNMARTSHCIFQYGDGIGTSIGVTKDRLISLIVEPVPI